MSYLLAHLHTGWHVDQAILAEEDRVVVIRFGHDFVGLVGCLARELYLKRPLQDSQCMTMDETLYGISEKIKNFAVIYLVDITEVPDFNKMYELYDAVTVMFFYRSPRIFFLAAWLTALASAGNKHIMIDLSTGNNNKINWPIEDKQELIDIVETIYRGASKGRGLVVSPKDYSTRLRY